MRKIIILLFIFAIIGCIDQKKEAKYNMNDDMIKSWGPQKEYFQKNNFKIISWDEAKKKLKEGRIKGGKQYHTGWLTLFEKDGDKYLTKQPKIDDIFEFLKENNLNQEGFGTE